VIRLGLFASAFVLVALWEVFTSRLALEFFKMPQAGYEARFTISVGQYLSVPFVALGLYLVMTAKIRAPSQGAHVQGPPSQG
jgi:phosphatidylglycerol:prolipoprotein diacylglycerol transferase